MDDLISRQAAIDALCHIDEYNAMSVSAIKALPSAQPDVPDTYVGDMISRQAAIDAAVKMFEAWYGGSVLRDREIRARFDVLPSAQPETAKRIVGKSRDGMTLWYQCDMCNEPVDAQDNFCSGCGRRLTDG